MSSSVSALYNEDDGKTRAVSARSVDGFVEEIAQLRRKPAEYDLRLDGVNPSYSSTLGSTISDDRYQLLVESVSDYAIFMLDTSGHIVTWSSGAARIKGYTADEILGRHFSCFYLPEDIASGKPDVELKIALEDGKYEEEGLRVRKNGDAFWAFVVITPLRDSSGNLRGFAKVTRDISDRKHAEEKTRMMVELALNAMILVDARGMLVLVNRQTEYLFGYRREELIGQPVELLVPESARKNHPAQRERFLTNPSVRAMGAGRDLHGQRKDGTLFPVEIGLNPVQSGDERFVLGSIVDITERKRTEEVSRQRLAQLAHAGRLSTVGEMFSGFAHEINQPLAAAANYARACVRFVRSHADVTQEQLLAWMEKASAQAERASQIVKRLGTFVKTDRAIRAEVNINTLVENVVDLTSMMTSATSAYGSTPVVLNLEESSLSLVFADKVQIEQVLVNLIRNAIEAMEMVAESRRKLTIATQRQGTLLQVIVSDTGHGISREDLPKLFNPFFTTKVEGMGLGLSISRSIIEAHHGRMIVESVPDVGTSISFLLPSLQRGAIP